MISFLNLICLGPCSSATNRSNNHLFSVQLNLPMTRVTIHSIVGMPELAECLSHYLTTADVTSAMATCRAWSKQLQPFLWTNFRPIHMLPRMSDIKQNLHHIRTIDLNQHAMRTFRNFEFKSFGDLLETLAHGLPIPPTAHSSEPKVVPESTQSIEASGKLCTNLKRIKLVLGRSDTALEESLWPALKTLLSYNRSLTHLNVEIVGLYEFPLSPMVPLLQPLSRLHHLTIRAPMQTASWFLSLLRACLPLPRLSEFYCYFAIVSGAQNSHDNTQDEPFTNLEAAMKTILLEAIAGRSSENGFVDTKIKAIRFPNQKESDSIRIVLPIMSSSLVEIETFEIPVLIDPRGEVLYEEIARKHCPGLRHLILPPYHCHDHPAAVCNFIRGATGLKTVRGRRCSGGHHGSRSSKIISTLAAHHFRTLEELEFSGCEMINRTDQQTILSSCKNLKRFWITPDGKYNQELGLRYQDIVDGEWVCLGMKGLCLSLDRTMYDQSAIVAMQESLQASRAQRLSEENEWEEQEEQEEKEDDLDQLGDEEQQRQVNSCTAKLVYTQIGRLSKLETLALGIERGRYGTIGDDQGMEWDLTLYKGWLAELSGLKNLRHLHMSTDFWSRMGHAEVKFMAAEWPLLDEISFDMKKRGLSNLVKQAHWKWLRQKRPNLRLRALHL